MATSASALVGNLSRRASALIDVDNLSEHKVVIFAVGLPNEILQRKLIAVALSLLCFPVFYSVYNIFFHPLRSYPGPWYSRISRLWYFIRALQGILPYEVKKLHDRYGPVVRIAPGELSYNCPDAWQDIYGRNPKPGSTARQLFQKDPIFYASFLDNEDTMVDAENDPYKNQKKSLSHGFSNKSIAASQDTLTKYQSLMVERLKEHIKVTEGPVDISVWISNALLDITTMLTADRDHQGIEHGDTIHPALATLNDTMAFLWSFLQFQRLPKPITWSIQKIIGVLLGHFKFFEKNDFSGHLLKDRLEHGSSRPDYVSYLVQSPEHVQGIQVDSLFPKASFLILAGTETTATALSGVIYNLLANPRTFELAAQEVRTTFSSSEDIDIESTRDLEYLKACISESQRTYPSTPGTFPRRVPRGGALIYGQHVPGNTVVGIPHYAAFHSSDNFVNPDKYIPERWLEEDSPDKHEAFHPFSFGPRICIAKELALSNMRQIMGRLLWEFNMELTPEAKVWTEQKTGLFPYRGPLYINIKSRNT